MKANLQEWCLEKEMTDGIHRNEGEKLGHCGILFDEKKLDGGAYKGEMWNIRDLNGNILNPDTIWPTPK